MNLLKKFTEWVQYLLKVTYNI